MQILLIEEKLPSLNDYINACRSNAYMGAKMKKDVERTISYYIIKSGLKAATNPVKVYIEWQEVTKKRDVDNVQSSVKFILDSLVNMGILQNDSPRYVEQIFSKVIYGDKFKITVELREVKNV